MIAAIILAAGQSKRMGQPKMLLPWGHLTVIEQVVSTFLEAGIEDIVVVTGGTRERVDAAIKHYPVRREHNPGYEIGEMLSSLHCGLRAMKAEAEAVLIGLGDQPQVESGTVRQIREAYLERRSPLLVPSFQRRRGHPWLVGRALWDELLTMKSPESPRDFLNRHATHIDYLNMDSPSILADLDTPQDYQTSRPT